MCQRNSCSSMDKLFLFLSPSDLRLVEYRCLNKDSDRKTQTRQLQSRYALSHICSAKSCSAKTAEVGVNDVTNQQFVLFGISLLHCEQRDGIPVCSYAAEVTLRFLQRNTISKSEVSFPDSNTNMHSMNLALSTRSSRVTCCPRKHWIRKRL